MTGQRKLDIWDSGTFNAKPGLILGPYESILAVLLWLDEFRPIVHKWNTNSPKLFDDFKLRAAIHPSKREQLLTAFLLFGKFDALAGMFLLDFYLNARGIIHSRRELFGEVIPVANGRRSPFVHSLEVGNICHLYEDELKPDPAQKERLVQAIMRVWARTGLTPRPEARQLFREAIELRTGLQPGWHVGPTLIQTPITSTLGAIVRSVESDIPLLSRDCVAPIWKAKSTTETAISILRVVWDEVSWLPRPKTFAEASEMRTDERLVHLQQAIDTWCHKLAVGDLSDWSDLRADIGQQVSRFKRKSWASRIAHITTYIALPTALVEILMSTSRAGITLTALGAASQCISDLIEKRRSSHWLSMGRDFVTKNVS
jgi:hypothetical protein